MRHNEGRVNKGVKFNSLKFLCLLKKKHGLDLNKRMKRLHIFNDNSKGTVCTCESTENTKNWSFIRDGSANTGHLIR